MEKQLESKKYLKLKEVFILIKKNIHYLEIIVKKYPEAIITGASAYYYHNLTDVIPDKIYLATKREATRIRDKRIKQ